MVQSNPSYHDFLVKRVKDQGIKNPEDYVTEHFYTEETLGDVKITATGVNLMLRQIGVVV